MDKFVAYIKMWDHSVTDDGDFHLHELTWHTHNLEADPNILSEVVVAWLADHYPFAQDINVVIPLVLDRVGNRNLLITAVFRERKPQC